MAKKNRVQETEQSTFDRAKAAFDRVGEDYIPASKVVEPSGAEEPVETPEAEKPVETPDETPDTDDAEPVPETSEPADSVPASDDSAEAETDVPPDAETSEPDDADTPATEPDDADTPVTEADDAPETSEPDDESVSEAQDDATPEVNDSDASETDEDSDEPDAVEDAPEEPEDASDSFWTFDADAPEAEVTEMEKLTMETKEITLGVHHSPPREADATPREQESKARFKAFERLKDAFKVRADSAEQADDTPASGSSRDAAIRKRVMQIEDEETRNYLLDRVLPQMTWYSKKSKQYQTMYYRLMAATILMGALIPAFSVGANSTVIKVILALLGASVTGINAYLALHNYHDLWITYRTTREDLIHHLYCYFNKAGVFSSSEDLDVLLVNVCEDTLSKENGGWTTIIQKT